MGLVARRLNLRCFIDGIEVPVIGCSCTFSEGAAATAQIQLVPSDQVYDIEPRAFVTLYYYEGYDYDRTPNGVELRRLGPQDLRRWKLLFSGEFITISYNKTSSGRSVSLVCVDHTNYWDFLKQSYVNFGNAGIEQFENAFMGVKLDRQKFYDVIGADLNSNIFKWLTASKGPDGEANLYLGIQRVLREMWFAANDFYARAFNRLRVGDQLVGIPDDTSAAKLFKLQFFEKFIKEQLGGGGGMVTVRQMVESTLGNVFHTFVTIPAPMFDRKGSCRGFSPTSGSTQDAALLSENIDRSLSWPEAALNYTIIKPDTWFLAPPSCNVIFPHQYTSMSFQRNYLQEPTRLFLRTSMLFTGQDAWLTERFYAPDFEVFNQQLYKEGGYLKRIAQTSLPHEEFVGLNPQEGWQADLVAYVAKGARRDYLARLADYLFWKSRYSTRGMEVSGPFNPNVVPGYSGLVINSVAKPDQQTRHYLGHVMTVTHVINQQSGGNTHISFAGAHVHDETADFDEKGRSLEEVTNRGTDGFLDDRYDSTRIGAEVYQRLFGCDSIYDKYSDFVPDVSDGLDPLAEKLFALEEAGMGDIPLAVEAIHGLYQRVVSTGSDVEAFTQSITWRPHANLLEMMGTSIAQAPNPLSQLDPTLIDLEALGREDPELASYDGFFCTCVDPDALTTKNATFTSVGTRSVAVTTTTKVPEVSIPVGDNTARLVLVAEKSVSSTTYTEVQDKKVGNYELSAHLEARRVKVQAYADSLRLRGVRG